MSLLLALSNEESFFPYGVRAFPPNALDCRIIWNKADKEMEDQKLSGTKGHFLCLSFAQAVSLQKQEQNLISTLRAQRCLLN